MRVLELAQGASKLTYATLSDPMTPPTASSTRQFYRRMASAAEEPLDVAPGGELPSGRCGRRTRPRSWGRVSPAKAWVVRLARSSLRRASAEDAHLAM